MKKEKLSNFKTFIRGEIVQYHKEQEVIQEYKKLFKRLLECNMSLADYFVIKNFFIDPMRYWFPELRKMLDETP